MVEWGCLSALVKRSALYKKEQGAVFTDPGESALCQSLPPAARDSEGDFIRSLCSADCCLAISNHLLFHLSAAVLLPDCIIMLLLYASLHLFCANSFLLLESRRDNSVGDSSIQAVSQFFVGLLPDRFSLVSPELG